jgi:hypothetical protein
MITKNKLYLFGDSFCHHPSHKNISETGNFVLWSELLFTGLNSKYLIQDYSEGSRDIQTILDCWIKILPEITKNDIVIVCLPSAVRYRLPRSEKNYKQEFNLTIRHIGQHADWDTKSNDLEIYSTNFTRDEIKNKLEDNVLINSSKANVLNNKELVEALTKLTPCRLYMFSWTRFKSGYKPYLLEDKTDLEKVIKWDTQHQQYERTNGKFGLLGDFHWSDITQIEFANYLINKFKK